MKVNICDVCYQEENRPSYATYTISYKNGQGTRLKLGVCEEHRNYFKVCKTFAEAEEKITALYNLPTRPIFTIFDK